MLFPGIEVHRSRTFSVHILNASLQSSQKVAAALEACCCGRWTPPVQVNRSRGWLVGREGEELWAGRVREKVGMVAVMHGGSYPCFQNLLVPFLFLDMCRVARLDTRRSSVTPSAQNIRSHFRKAERCLVCCLFFQVLKSSLWSYRQNIRRHNLATH